jgi:hypothetical protein
MHCPTFQTLVEFVDGLGSLAERQAVERHLSDGCVSCASAVAWYGSVREAARADHAPEPPPWLAARAIASIHEAREAARRRGLKGFLARISAALVGDSFSVAPAGTRGTGEARQLLYFADAFDVDLFVAEAGRSDRLRVAGQVLAAGDGGFEDVVRLTVELEREGRIAGSAETSEIGEFAFEDIVPGRYEIHIVGEWREILLSDVPLSLE